MNLATNVISDKLRQKGVNKRSKKVWCKRLHWVWDVVVDVDARSGQVWPHSEWDVTCVKRETTEETDFVDITLFFWVVHWQGRETEHA